ncbi:MULTISPECIES: DUF2913 family protein [unclassified Vibrio]|uniref:DUF2913 family protein n=1 Tax=Vibrio sp. HB236076 TaxID=3232307 RepID=A0AB39HL42_9VIBR|nr:DUF2913 family protein [Vibrio sp. HB161653]MDP5253275.1 DUF2913 family protein [Vibrio sp. HB161653]
MASYWSRSQSHEDSLLIKQIAIHALLFLYANPSHISLSVHDRNALLLRWLKSRTKQLKYKSIKKPLKILLQQGKQNGNLEHLLDFCLSQNLPTPKPPHLDSFLLLLRDIEKKLGTTVLHTSPREVDLKHDENGCLLCVLTENLHQHFNEHNQLIAPITMLFRGPLHLRQHFLSSIYISETFRYQVGYQDDEFVRIELQLTQ